MSIIGTCNLMCPESELKEHGEGLLSPFEADRKGYFDPKKAIKKYKRINSIQNIDLNTIRPINILLQTTKYILDNLISQIYQKASNETELSLYLYVRDRLRAIRQDIILQQIHGQDCIKIYEFYSLFFLWSGLYFGNLNQKGFDFVQNFEQITQGFLSLSEEYSLSHNSQNMEIFEAARVATYFTHEDFNEEIAKMKIGLKYLEQLINLRESHKTHNIKLFVETINQLPFIIAGSAILSDKELFIQTFLSLRISFKNMSFSKDFIQNECFTGDYSDIIKEAFHVKEKNESLEYFDVSIPPDSLTNKLNFIIPKGCENILSSFDITNELQSLL